MTRKIIVLLGLPGSGKGTQGAMLAKEIFIPHISTGDILRKMVNSSSEESSILKFYMEDGRLVPSDLVNKIVRKYILSGDGKQGCILDGYPRNLEQAEYLIENVDDNIVAILFDVADEISMKRIMGRFSCSSCGELYNKFFNNTKLEGVCDSCGSKDLTYRSDDSQITLQKRLDEYKKETLPLVDYYKSRNKLFRVDASGSKDDIKENLLSILKKI